MNCELLLSLSIAQSALLALAQVALKYALLRMEPFLEHGFLSSCHEKGFWYALLLNWPFALSGLCFAGGSMLWIHILRHYPLNQAYPLLSLSYVMGMICAVLFFHETVPLMRWMGVLLIMAGCVLVAR